MTEQLEASCRGEYEHDFYVFSPIHVFAATPLGPLYIQIATDTSSSLHSWSEGLSGRAVSCQSVCWFCFCVSLLLLSCRLLPVCLLVLLLCLSFTAVVSSLASLSVGSAFVSLFYCCRVVSCQSVCWFCFCVSLLLLSCRLLPVCLLVLLLCLSFTAVVSSLASLSVGSAFVSLFYCCRVVSCQSVCWFCFCVSLLLLSCRLLPVCLLVLLLCLSFTAVVSSLASLSVGSAFVSLFYCCRVVSCQSVCWFCFCVSLLLLSCRLLPVCLLVLLLCLSFTAVVSSLASLSVGSVFVSVTVALSVRTVRCDCPLYCLM